MNSTETTPAPAVGGRQVGELLAGRYRLGVFKGGDDIADVWHALDESSEKVVTLEILRDRENEPARQRFLAEAHRMAAIERPSVMRVAAIHDEASDTFIVFEHLIPLPVVLTGLTGIAKDSKPATQAADDKTAVLASSAPRASAPVEPSPFASVVTPDVAEAEGAPSIVDLDVTETPALSTTPRVPDAPHSASSSLMTARSEVSGLAHDLAADVRGVVRDAALDELVAAARARIPRGLDMSLPTSLMTRATALAARATALAARATAFASRATAFVSRATALASRITAPLRSARIAPKARPSSPRAAEPARRDTTRIGIPLPTITAKLRAGLQVAMSIATRVGSAPRPRIGRLRPHPVVSAGVIGILLLAAFIMSPLDDAVVSALRSAPWSSSETTSQGGLAPAPFELPPLSAYGAAFDSQGAYPTAAPNGMVEWVVALRNTGSVGWYRGIQGAQAALALTDGTGVAVQSTPYVAPGQVGWFVVHFRARAEPGTYTVPLLPRIDGRGSLPELGIYAVVTVAKNP